MKLVGIEIANYRSIGNTPIVLNPLSKCSILIGANNSGKSNVLKAIASVCALFGKASDFRFSPVDYHKRNDSTPIAIRLTFFCDDPNNPLVQASETNQFWFTLHCGQDNQLVIADFSLAHITNHAIADKVYRHLVGPTWPRAIDAKLIRDSFLPKAHALFKTQFEKTFPYTYFVPEFRQIKAGGTYSLSGNNLVELLGDYKNPVIGKDADLDKFRRIEEFVQKLLHLPKATLDVSRKNPEIIVINDNLRLPLSSYGTGVHELVILITAVLAFDNAIFCIEEPEIHLHPRLQREFIDFIIKETKNTYLLSTHSQTFINYSIEQKDVQVLHLQNCPNGTLCNRITEETHCLAALRDLGVKASDLLQANGVIWVEGPSDRIYLKRWLELMNPNQFVEGRDYSIMFYGGKLLSHLTFAAGIIADDLIKLLRINQNAVIIIDSDRNSKAAELNKTKVRIQEECEKIGALCWITDGREIENYLADGLLSRYIIKKVKRKISVPLGEFDDIEKVLSDLPYDGEPEPVNLSYGKHKVDVARAFTEMTRKEDLSDQLRERITAVAGMIQKWSQ